MEHEKLSMQEEFAFFSSIKSEEKYFPLPPRAPAKDLVGSKTKLAFIYSVGCLMGYIVSLALCAQCSVGLTPLAWKTAELMGTLNAASCALLCGAIFGLGPVIFSSLTLTRFQHRYLLYRMTWLPALIPLASSLIMTLLGSAHDWMWHGLWIGSAVITPYLVEGASAFWLRQHTWTRKRVSPEASLGSGE